MHETIRRVGYSIAKGNTLPTFCINLYQLLCRIPDDIMDQTLPRIVANSFAATKGCQRFLTYFRNTTCKFILFGWAA